MAKFSLNKLSEEKRIQMIAEFYDVISSLRGRKEVRSFFRDLLTPDEVAMLMRRVEVATLLKSGFTYEQIAKLLGVGRDKVSNVQRSLQRHGEGYDIVMKRLLYRRQAIRSRRIKQAKTRDSAFTILKKKYPLGFLLFNLIDELGELLEYKENKEMKDRRALEDTPSRRK